MQLLEGSEGDGAAAAGEEKHPLLLGDDELTSYLPRHHQHQRSRSFPAFAAFISVNLALIWLLLHYYKNGAMPIPMWWKADQDTIEEILARRNISAKQLLENNTNKKAAQPQRPDDCHAFSYLKVDCDRVLSVEDSQNHSSKFEICHMGLTANVMNKMQGLVNGMRNSATINNENTTTTTTAAQSSKSRIVVDESQSTITEQPYIISPSSKLPENYELGVLTDRDRHQQGLKDLIDANGDIDRVEIFKFELLKSTFGKGISPETSGRQHSLLPSPPPLLKVLLSITPGVDYCQLLLRMEFTSFRELRDLVAQLNSAGFYPFGSSQHEPPQRDDPRVSIVSLAAMSKACMWKYGVSQPQAALWTRDDKGTFFCDTM